MTANADYGAEWEAGYARAIQDVQEKFLPLWRAVQGAVAESHEMDAFISAMRKRVSPTDGSEGRP